MKFSFGWIFYLVLLVIICVEDYVNCAGLITVTSEHFLVQLKAQKRYALNFSFCLLNK